jgi:hypothetical protein
MLMPVMFNGPLPVFERVTVCAALVVPAFCEAKLKLVAETDAVGAMPLPEMLRMCGEPEALSLTVKVPGKLAPLLGENVMDTLQLVPAARLEPHVLVESYSAGERTMLEMVSEALPLLVMVTDFAELVVPTPCVPNDSEEGENVSADPKPVPARLTLCGEPTASSVIESVPVRLPIAVGLKVTETVQLAFTASVAPQVVVRAKSLGVTAVVDMFSVAVPRLVTVTFCAAVVVPTFTLPNDKVAGESETAGELVAPVPLRATDCGLPTKLVAIASEPLRVPEAVGVKVTETVQLEPAASDAPQVVADFAKSPEAVMELKVTLPACAVSVTVVAALVVFRACVPKTMELGETVNDAPTGTAKSHIPRPWVEARKVRLARCNCNPRAATLGKLLARGAQLVPPFEVLKTPMSVPI